MQSKTRDQKTANFADELSDELLEIQTLIDNDADNFKQRPGIPRSKGVERLVEDLARNESQDFTHVFIGDFLSTKRNDLIQNRLCIAHAAFGGFDNIAQCPVVDLYTLAIGNLAEMLVDFRGRNSSKGKLLAPRQDRGGKLMPFCRRHDEYDMRRRLFQNLEESVEGRCRKHVNFINDEDLVPASRRRVFRALT